MCYEFLHGRPVGASFTDHGIRLWPGQSAPVGDHLVTAYDARSGSGETLCADGGTGYTGIDVEWNSAYSARQRA